MKLIDDRDNSRTKDIRGIFRAPVEYLADDNRDGGKGRQERNQYWKPSRQRKEEGRCARPGQTIPW